MADNVRWARVLKSLMPPGKLFDDMAMPPATGEGPVLWRLFKAFGLELARLELRILQALSEMDPRTATETIGDWERAIGLPDLRVPVLPTLLTQRRAVVAAKLVARGDQSEEGYRALIEACGWTLVELRRVWTAPWLDCESEHPGYVGGLEWSLTVEFVVGGETLDSMAMADLTRLLQHTMQLHAFALVTHAP